jgi:Zn finger protein HypA/HybF involved in hydrogenase expression
MAFLQKEMWECPFCESATIEVIIRPTTYVAKRSAVRGGRKTSYHKVNQEVIILTESCPNCGKKSYEIEKKWRDEKII